MTRNEITEIHDKAVKISDKLSLRPPIVIPKGTFTLSGRLRFTRVRFIKELNNTWNSGVLIDFNYDESDGKFKKYTITFRNDENECHLTTVEKLTSDIEIELNK